MPSESSSFHSSTSDDEIQDRIVNSYERKKLKFENSKKQGKTKWEILKIKKNESNALVESMIKSQRKSKVKSNKKVLELIRLNLKAGISQERLHVLPKQRKNIDKLLNLNKFTDKDLKEVHKIIDFENQIL